MHVRFAAPELGQIDALRCEALALPFFSDERPLRGALGLLDWRMCGFVSRMLASGKIEGSPLETILIPGRPKLSMDKLFLFGLGPLSAFDPPLLERGICHMLDVLARARVRSTALVLPGRNVGCIGAEGAMEAFFGLAMHREEHDEIVLLEPPDAQREMGAVIERERRRARAQMQ
jgi:hypothetical protein